MMNLFGIETEYGITREDVQEMDPVIESMALVRAYTNKTYPLSWDYHGEDPHEDARGFRSGPLSQDEEEASFSKNIDAHRPFSFREVKSDLVLVNGARFYNDHTHPEYSTPECSSIRDLVLHDKAGEWILRYSAQCRNRQLGVDQVQLYKNNTDFHGHSYGCHDNYLIPRSVPFDILGNRLIPFLVTRQIYCGSGKMGIQTGPDRLERGRYQISQRADFIETELSIDTMTRRPILNTRDEPHADPNLYRRLHLILGDANMSEFATALKVGTTSLVLELIQRGKAPEAALENPVDAIRSISRDPGLRQAVSMKNGSSISPIALQGLYLEAARKHLSGEDPERDWILSQWEEVLTLLEKNPHQLVDRIDWITKRWLLQTFCDEENIPPTDPWVMSLDLEYHNLDPERGLYLGLESEGKTFRVTKNADIERAMVAPPGNTRAAVRALCLRRFSDYIDSVQWEKITFKNGWRKKSLDLNRTFDPKDIRTLCKQLESVPSLEDLFEWLETR